MCPRNWARPFALQHSFSTAYKSITDLQENKNLRAVQLVFGHSKLESTMRYLGIEVDDALEVAEQIEI